MGSVEVWQSLDAWVLAVAIGLPALAKVAIFWLALRGTQPAERPKIISALAELFRWWRRTGSTGARK